MEPTETESKSDDLEAKINESVQRVLNSAVSSHLKRAMGGLSKDLEGMIAKAIAAQAPVPADVAPEKPTGEPAKPIRDKAAEDRMAALEKRLAEREKALADAQQKQARDTARTELRSHLEKVGVTGARARSLISDFELSGAVRWDEDGTPRLAVRRSRSKGAAADEALFDLAEGVDDWAKSPEASDFIAAPTAGRTSGLRGPGSTGGQRGPVTKYDKPAATEHEAGRRTLEQLQAQGMDVGTIAALISGNE